MFLEALERGRHDPQKGGQKTHTTIGHCENAGLGCGNKSRAPLYLTTDTLDPAPNTNI